MNKIVDFDVTKELNDIKSRLEGLEMRILSMGRQRDAWEDAQRKAFTLKGGVK